MTSNADQPRHSFVYVAEGHTGPMASAEAGCTVRIPGRGPPWIAVDHDVSSVVVARWPGRLWAVEIVDPITDADLRAAGQVGWRADAGYTRAARPQGPCGGIRQAREPHADRIVQGTGRVGVRGGAASGRPAAQGAGHRHPRQSRAIGGHSGGASHYSGADRGSARQLARKERRHAGLRRRVDGRRPGF